MELAKRCLMCFAARSTDPYPGTDIPLCRGCKFQSDKLIGFWETQGYGMQLVNLGLKGRLDLEYPGPEKGEGETPLTPQGSTKSTRKKPPVKRSTEETPDNP